jgi:hypothetical protein
LSSSRLLFGISAELVQMLEARSGWVWSMPESRTPTRTEEEPVWVSQAEVASMSMPEGPPDWPVLFRCHWEGKEGSLGVAAAWSRASVTPSYIYILAKVIH